MIWVEVDLICFLIDEEFVVVCMIYVVGLVGLECDVVFLFGMV